MTLPSEYGPDPVAQWIIDECGWQDHARILRRHLTSQVRVVTDGWWIGIDTHYPYTRTRLCAGRVEEAGTFADVSALLADPVDANDRTALDQAVQELRKRLDTPQP